MDEQLREALTRMGAPETAGVEWFEREIERLRPLADDGTAYRSDLVSDALTEGARAFGSAFAQETYKGILQRASLVEIKAMRDDWKRIGDAKFPGGRGTVEGADDDSKGAKPAPKPVPDRAYRL